MEGYVVEIIDINDNQGFPMKQGVLTDGSIGERKEYSYCRTRRIAGWNHESGQGCIVNANLSFLT